MEEEKSQGQSWKIKQFVASRNRLFSAYLREPQQSLTAHVNPTTEENELLSKVKALPREQKKALLEALKEVGAGASATG